MKWVGTRRKGGGRRRRHGKRAERKNKGCGEACECALRPRGKKGTAKEEAEAEGERTGGATRGGGGVEGRIRENHVVNASGL